MTLGSGTYAFTPIPSTSITPTSVTSTSVTTTSTALPSSHPTKLTCAFKSFFPPSQRITEQFLQTQFETSNDHPFLPLPLPSRSLLSQIPSPSQNSVPPVGSSSSSSSPFSPLLGSSHTRQNGSSSSSIPFDNITNPLKLYLDLEVLEVEEVIIAWFPTTLILQSLNIGIPSLSFDFTRNKIGYLLLTNFRIGIWFLKKNGSFQKTRTTQTPKQTITSTSSSSSSSSSFSSSSFTPSILSTLPESTRQLTSKQFEPVYSNHLTLPPTPSRSFRKLYPPPTETMSSFSVRSMTSKSWNSFSNIPTPSLLSNNSIPNDPKQVDYFVWNPKDWLLLYGFASTQDVLRVDVGIDSLSFTFHFGPSFTTSPSFKSVKNELHSLTLTLASRDLGRLFLSQLLEWEWNGKEGRKDQDKWKFINQDLGETYQSLRDQILQSPENSFQNWVPSLYSNLSLSDPSSTSKVDSVHFTFLQSFHRIGLILPSSPSNQSYSNSKLTTGCLLSTSSHLYIFPERLDFWPPRYIKSNSVKSFVRTLPDDSDSIKGLVTDFLPRFGPPWGVMPWKFVKRLTQQKVSSFQMEEEGERREMGSLESLFEMGWIGSLSNQNLDESQNSEKVTIQEEELITGEARGWLWWIQVEMEDKSPSWNLFFSDSNQVQLFVSQARILSPSTIVLINA